METNNQEIEKQVVDVIRQKLGSKNIEIDRSSGLVSDLKLDSIDLPEAVIEIEKSFGLQFQDSDFDKLETVGDLIDLVETYQRN